MSNTARLISLVTLVLLSGVITMLAIYAYTNPMPLSYEANTANQSIKERIYEVKLSGDGRYLKTIQMSNSSQLLNVESNLFSNASVSLQGELHRTQFRDENNFLISAYWLSNAQVKITADGAEAKDLSQNITSQLLQPCFTTSDGEGNIKGVICDLVRVSENARSVVTNLASLFQLHLLDTGEEKWEVNEDTDKGTFRIQYQVLKANRNDVGDISSRIQQVKKTFLTYMPPSNREVKDDVLSDQPVIAKGPLEVSFRSLDKVITAINGTQEYKMFFLRQDVGESHNSIAIALKREIGLTPKSFSELKNQYDQIKANNVAFSLSSPVTEEEKEKEYGRSHVGDEAPEKILEQLANYNSITQISEAENKLVVKLRSVFWVYPETVFKAKELTKNLPLTDRRVSIFIQALGECGSREAQQALREIIQSSLITPDNCTNIIVTLGMVRHPTKETADYLRDLPKNNIPDDLKKQSEVVLGIVARSLLKTDSGDADQLTDYLMNKLSVAQSDELKSHYLMALGNAGNQKALPYIKSQLSNSNMGVRSDAVSALRFIKAQEALPLIRSALNDVEPFVRREALATLAYQQIDRETLAVLRDLAVRDKSAEIRGVALKILGEIEGDTKEFKELARKISLSDQDDDIRKMAKHLLKPHYPKNS